jgi:acetylglutamate kinase
MIVIDNDGQTNDKAQTLIEAFSLIEQYSGEYFVILYDGSALNSQQLADYFAEDVVLLQKIGINPIIIHGAGDKIDDALNRMQISTSVSEGKKFAKHSTIEVIEMILSGLVNKQIVYNINKNGGTAIGLSGKDGNLVEARRLLRRTKSSSDSNIQQIIDLEFVGEPVMINPEILINLEETDLIPVIAPIGVGENGESYNLSPIHLAAIISGTLAACKLIIMTDEKLVVKGEPLEKDLPMSYAVKLLESEGVSTDLRELLRVAVTALEHHTESVNIINASVPHALLTDLFSSERSGSLIYL